MNEYVDPLSGLRVTPICASDHTVLTINAPEPKLTIPFDLAAYIRSIARQEAYHAVESLLYVLPVCTCDRCKAIGAIS